LKAATRISVLLASENALLSDCLVKRLGGEPGLRLVGRVAGAAELLAALRRGQPDVLVFDLDGVGALPEDLLARLRQRSPQLRILVVASRADDHAVARVLRHGANGVLGRGEGFPQLLEAMTAVAAGQPWARRRAIARALETFPREADRTRPDLTPRERQLLGLLGDGYRNKELASLLKIKEQTVKIHLHSLFRKLNVRSRVEAALRAAELG
jgi:two-component system, NarL family, nitrate/nitrite response regulator NarL